MTPEAAENLRQRAKIELARRNLWHYCQVRTPGFYLDDRTYLHEMTDTIQAFIENPAEHFLIISAPPRHGKTLTAQHTSEWLLGKNPETAIITGSYNEILSQQFSKAVRNTIMERKVDASRLVFSDIFPGVAIKRGDASAKLWGIEGVPTTNYLATSPGGTATGIGANILILDDTIKNPEEAYNLRALDAIWQWFTSNLMQRTEGNDYKIIVIATRWAKGDLSGRILDNYPGAREILLKAVQEPGKMLDSRILSWQDYQLKTQEMNPDIAEANYNQTPIDRKGILYPELMEWTELPEDLPATVYGRCDTADTGTDYLVSIYYRKSLAGDIYITHLFSSDEPMEYTEPATAKDIKETGCAEFKVESNNGGRGFARNIERLLNEAGTACSIITAPQSANKEARIMASETFVKRHIFMPPNWRQKYPEAYRHITTYMRGGRNQHDDEVDVLASIYEDNSLREAKIQSIDDLYRQPKSRRAFTRSW
jgi:predicted phage terminase large subunit-like protein